MIVFVIIGQIPTILGVTLLAMVYLAWIEVRHESGVSFEVKLWWILLVFLFNVIGYLALRVWVAGRRRRRRAEAEG